MKRILSFILMIVLIFSLNANCNKPNDGSNGTIKLDEVEDVKNIILLIGDGMGPEQIRAGALYKKEDLYFQGFPYKVEVDTTSYGGVLTDSAAASTAMATGTLTTNGHVGKNVNGDDLQTIVDFAYSLGKRTGVITTEELYGATPMGFSGHSLSRTNSEELIASAAQTSNINLFASSIMKNKYRDILLSNGYCEIENVDDISNSTEDKIFGIYNIEATADINNSSRYSLALGKLVEESLDYLANDKDGFFLMAEGAHIDHGGHENDINYMLRELIAFDDAVKVAVEWASKRKDTVVIVTADHETGGLVLKDGVNEDNLLESDDALLYKNFYWTTTGHTTTRVNFYVNGANINFSNYYLEGQNYIKNIQIFNIIKDLFA